MRASSMLATGSNDSGIPCEVFIGCSLENTMAKTFTLTSDAFLRDAQTFVKRAARVNNSSARLIAADGFLQVYVGVLFPRGLLDRTPTVLGLHVFPLEQPEEFDVVVPLESLAHRIGVALEQDKREVDIPAEVASLAWAAITPPRDEWKRRFGVASAALSEAAQSGIARVAEAVPANAGESIVQKVRAEVWGETLAHHKRIPAGAAFAADALGLLEGRNLQVHTRDNWVRLSSKTGYVLVKFPSGHDFGPDDDAEDEV